MDNALWLRALLAIQDASWELMLYNRCIRASCTRHILRCTQVVWYRLEGGIQSIELNCRYSAESGTEYSGL
jgi:hypothetical protein